MQNSCLFGLMLNITLSSHGQVQMVRSLIVTKHFSWAILTQWLMSTLCTYIIDLALRDFPTFLSLGPGAHDFGKMYAYIFQNGKKRKLILSF